MFEARIAPHPAKRGWLANLVTRDGYPKAAEQIADTSAWRCFDLDDEAEAALAAALFRVYEELHSMCKPCVLRAPRDEPSCKNCGQRMVPALLCGS